MNNRNGHRAGKRMVALVFFVSFAAMVIGGWPTEAASVQAGQVVRVGDEASARWKACFKEEQKCFSKCSEGAACSNRYLARAALKYCLVWKSRFPGWSCQMAQEKFNALDQQCEACNDQCRVDLKKCNKKP